MSIDYKYPLKKLSVLGDLFVCKITFNIDPLVGDEIWAKILQLSSLVIPDGTASPDRVEL